MGVFNNLLFYFYFYFTNIVGALFLISTYNWRINELKKYK